MTRKQALHIAIELLQQTNPDSEAAQVLESLSEDLPLVYWTDIAINDSIEQFILDHKRIPTATDFKHRGLPPHPIFKIKYGVTLKEWMNQHYPTPPPDKDKLRKMYNKEFTSEYNRLRPSGQDKYNKGRRAGTKSWYTVARANGVQTWRQLIDLLKLPHYTRSMEQIEPEDFAVSVTHDLDF